MVLRALAALAQSSRLRTFRMLVVAGTAGANPTAMATRLRITPATLSFHLKELLNAGLITQQRSGRNITYRADFRHMNDLLGYLTENCCRGESCSAAAKSSCAPGR